MRAMELRVNPPGANGSLSQRIRDARDAVALSQAELAQRLGVSARTVQYWESGKVPHPKNRRELLEFLDFVEGRAA